MTIVTIERVGAPASARAARALDLRCARAADGLAGRTVWCTTALPTGRGPAETLRAHLRARGEVTADSLELAAAEPLRDLAQQLDAVLRTASPDVSPIGGRPVLGAAERALLRDGRRDGEAMAGDRVLTGDVVVLHDALTAVVAEAVRELGAHVVWEVKVSQGASAATVRQVWDFLRGVTSAIDAFAMSWEGPGHEGRPVERLVAVMPGADAVATTEIATDAPQREPYEDIGWTGMLADVVSRGRAERVGGTRHARPAVPHR